jgi:hypothetical protein
VWDYFDGEIIEHSLPDGTIGRAWRLGGPLRNVHWDCDGDHLLAVTCLGGFRLAAPPLSHHFHVLFLLSFFPSQRMFFDFRAPAPRGPKHL